MTSRASIDRDGQLGELPIAGPAGSDGVGRHHPVDPLGLPLDGVLIEGPLVHQAGDGTAENLIPRTAHQHRHHEGEHRISPGQTRARKGQAAEHAQGDEDVGAGVEGVGQQKIAVEPAAGPGLEPHHPDIHRQGEDQKGERQYSRRSAAGRRP